MLKLKQKIVVELEFWMRVEVNLGELIESQLAKVEREKERARGREMEQYTWGYESGRHEHLMETGHQLRLASNSSNTHSFSLAQGNLIPSPFVIFLFSTLPSATLFPVGEIGQASLNVNATTVAK